MLHIQGRQGQIFDNFLVLWAKSLKIDKIHYFFWLFSSFSGSSYKVQGQDFNDIIFTWGQPCHALKTGWHSGGEKLSLTPIQNFPFYKPGDVNQSDWGNRSQSKSIEVIGQINRSQSKWLSNRSKSRDQTLKKCKSSIDYEWLWSNYKWLRSSTLDFHWLQLIWFLLID